MARLPYDDCVFINCRFDDPDFEIFQAVVFAILDCGFIPRCAQEKSDGSEIRIEKIFRMIYECRYAVHDLSATDPDSKNKLPRFNMPLELGIFLGVQRYGSPKKQKRKSCIIIERERYRYHIFCSDISGQDVGAHGDEPRKAIKLIRDWLRGERPEVRLPGGERMFKRYELFKDDLPWICDSLNLDPRDLHFNDLRAVIGEWLDLNPW